MSPASSLNLGLEVGALFISTRGFFLFAVVVSRFSRNLIEGGPLHWSSRALESPGKTQLYDAHVVDYGCNVYRNPALDFKKKKACP